MAEVQSVLIPCNEIYGGVTITDLDPEVRVVRDVSFTPDENRHIALFHQNGRAVSEAITYRGLEHRHQPLAPISRHPMPGKLPRAPQEFDYVYVGFLHAHHYGHFLLDGLSAFWNIRTVPQENIRFVYADAIGPAELFGIPFVAQIFGLLGLCQEHFVHCPGGMFFPWITVPAKSFEENNVGYKVFGRLCNRIGALMTANLEVRVNTKPVYLSKHLVTHGVSTVVNENEVVDELLRLGVDIVCPEQLSLAQQIMLWRERPLVLGIIGSAFHTGIFVPRPRSVVINHGPRLWSNQVILDRLNDASAEYYYPAHGFQNSGTDARFGINFTIGNPIELAQDLYDTACRSGTREMTSSEG